jgi:FkbM family methyltransferase
VLRRFAASNPRISKVLLAFGFHFPRIRKHWVFQTVAGDMNWRKPSKSILGNGMPIELWENDTVCSEIQRNGWYEPETVRIVESLLRPGMTFFDVGAHVGQYTLLGANVVGQTGQVQAFEADPDTFALLMRNVTANRLGNVITNHCAISAHEGTVELFLGSPENIGTNSLRKPGNFSGRSATVSSTKLSTYINGEDTKPNLIKLDIEGAELDALKTIAEYLNRSDAPTLIIEFCEKTQQRFGHSCAELAAFLKHCGYSLYTITEDGMRQFSHSDFETGLFNVVATKQQ